MGSRAGETATGNALAMLSAFASVNAQAFNLTLTDINGEKIPGGYKPNRPLEELRGTIGGMLRAAALARHNVIIRPRSSAATLIQLDDLDFAKAERIAPRAFLVFESSPANYQAWVAVGPGAPEDFRRRLRKGIGADPTASNSTRIAGSLNFKSKYAPAFPMVNIIHANPGNVTTAVALERAGLLARREEPQMPPASVPPHNAPSARSGTRHWPDYQQTLRGAPRKGDGTPDRSLADFMFCKWAVQRGWSVEETAEKLAEVSAAVRP